MKNDFVYIFVHLHKTGGTTINKHLEKNFKKEEVLFLNYPVINVDPYGDENQNFKKIAEEFILKLSNKDREKIKVISGHFVPYGVHKYFSKIPRYITFSREPYDRAKSLYNYFMTLYSRERVKGKQKKLYKSFLLVNNHVPKFDKWAKNKYNTNFVLSSESKFYKALGYKLPKFHFIGNSNNKDDFLYIYKLLGINKFFINQNKSENFVDIDKLKIFFNKKYSESNNFYKKTYNKNNYHKKELIIIKIKRYFLLLFTQVFFDFKHSVRMLSSYMHKKSKIYTIVLEFLKHGLYKNSSN